MTKFEQIPDPFKGAYLMVVNPKIDHALDILLLTVATVLEGEEMEDAVRRLLAVVTILNRAMGQEPKTPFEQMVSEVTADAKRAADEMPMPV